MTRSKPIREQFNITQTQIKLLSHVVYIVGVAD
jgi:hypothetical protein